jgi:titin
VTALTYTKTGLSAGTTYKFKVSARNSIGTGSLSSEFTIVAATIPSTPASPTTTYDGITDTVTIDFNSPTDNGGLTITGYVIQIQHADSSWSTETSNCDGLNNSTVQSTTACTIPASVLRASPFSLA